MSETVRFDQPPSAVFDALTEPQQLAAWNHAFDHAERLDDGPLDVGSRLRAESRVDGRPAVLDVEVVALERPNRLELEASSGEVSSLTTFVVRAADGGSDVTVTSGAIVGDEGERTVDPEANPTFADLGSTLLDGLRAVFADGPVEPR